MKLNIIIPTISDIFCLLTAYVVRREGNVLTRVCPSFCLSTPGGGGGGGGSHLGYPPSDLAGGGGGGYPSDLPGGQTVDRQDRKSENITFPVLRTRSVIKAVMNEIVNRSTQPRVRWEYFQIRSKFRLSINHSAMETIPILYLKFSFCI